MSKTNLPCDAEIASHNFKLNQAIKRDQQANPAPRFADRRAVAMGAADITVNNMNPTWTGIIEVNGTEFPVYQSQVIDGVLYYVAHGNGGLALRFPAFICNIP